ncbi:hypothetical protein [Microbacterium indicum]|uniref:hypothetical protein n=1 Tax=Microbacterium indicum TaxID=358100 RepID=UPI0004224263|nr:hypothetical protein [Microbacterium indicum]
MLLVGLLLVFLVAIVGAAALLFGAVLVVRLVHDAGTGPGKAWFRRFFVDGGWRRDLPRAGRAIAAGARRAWAAAARLVARIRTRIDAAGEKAPEPRDRSDDTGPLSVG